MTTPLKALIQERLRAKIVRQEGDDDEDDMGLGSSHDDEDEHGHHHREFRLAMESPRMTMQTRRVHVHHHHHDSTSADYYRVVPTPSHHSHTTQKVLNYYSYEHQQEVESGLRRDKSFAKAFDDSRYKTPFYDDEEHHDAPLPSPWRHSQQDEAAGRFSSECHDPVESAMPLKSPYNHHHRPLRVHPVDAESFPRGSLEASSSKARDHRAHEPRSPAHFNFDYRNRKSNQQLEQQQQQQHYYHPRGHLASQLYHESKQEERPDYQQHHHRSHHHPGVAEEDQQPQPTENPTSSPLSRKRGYGTFDEPYEIVDDTHEPLRERAHRHSKSPECHRKYKIVIDDDEHRSQQQRHHDVAAERITSPLGAAVHLAPMMPAIVGPATASSPRPETSNYCSDRQNRSTATSASSVLPAPLDMAIIDSTRKPEPTSQTNSYSHPRSNTSHSASSSTLTRRFDSMLSPRCHRAAKVHGCAFVEKRRRRTTNSTPRTMATQRWLQSFDPDFIDLDAVHIQETTRTPSAHPSEPQASPPAPPHSSTGSNSATSIRSRKRSSPMRASPV